MLDLDDDMNLDYNRPGETPQSPPASTEEFEVLSWDSREVEQRLSAAHLIVRSILNRAPRRKLDQIIKRVRDSAPLIHSSDLVFNRCVIEALNLYPPEQRYPVTKLLVYGWGGKALGNCSQTRKLEKRAYGGYSTGPSTSMNDGPRRSARALLMQSPRLRPM